MQPCSFSFLYNGVHIAHPFRYALGQASVGERQAEDGGAVFLGQGQEFLQPFLFRRNGVDEGAARVGPQACFEGYRVAGVNGQGGIGELGDFRHGFLHGGCLVDAAYPHVHIKHLGAGFHLPQGFFLHGEEGAFLDFCCQLLPSRGVDALAYEHRGAAIVKAHGLGAAGEPEHSGAVFPHRFCLVLYRFGQGPDVLRGSAAAAPQIGGACCQELRPPGAKVLRPHGELGFPVFQIGHARIGLDADGHPAVGSESLHDGQELLGAQGAVHADDISPQGFQQDSRALGVGARHGAPILAVGELADFREPRCPFVGGQKGGPHFLQVDASLDDEGICATFGKSLGLGQIVLIGFLEVKVAQRRDKPPDRPHGADYLGLHASFGNGLLGYLHRRYVQLPHAVSESVVSQLQRAGPKGVGLDVV